MSNPRVMQLLEEILESGRTPEEACVGAPELLPEVRAQLRLCARADAFISDLFPLPAADHAGGLRADPLGIDADTSPLPAVPGYEVQSVLGRGGMGVVYRARHVALNRTVALKMLLSGAYAAAGALARFRREAEAVAGLRHPHIVQVYDVGQVEGRPYYTMEFVEGGSLAEHLGGVPQTAARAAALTATLAEAVHAAHAGGIIHRDLKPANVLLRADGTPAVTDFGLARDIGGDPTITLSGVRIGTPSYMAPEQAAGRARSIGPATDVYALGAVLYELLTGRPPFRGENALETERQVLEEEPAPPRRLNAKVSRDLETICLKCLAKEPGGRYPSAAALAEDLRRFQRGEPISARPAGVLRRSMKWVRRRPAAATLLAGGVLFVGAIAAGTAWFVAERAATTAAVEERLREVAEHERLSAWDEARAAVENARARLGGRGSRALRDRVDHAAKGLDLVDKLHAIRLAESTSEFEKEGQAKQTADREYERAFAAHGLGTVGEDAAAVAQRIKAAAVRPALVSALDHWAICADAEPERQDWLLAVARDADVSPSEWAARVRDRTVWRNPAALEELAEAAPVAVASESLLNMLGYRLLAASGAKALPFLKKVHAAHPGDFWSNYHLARLYAGLNRHADAARFYQAAVALRPDARVYGSLGISLGAEGRYEEALECFRRSLDLQPDFREAHRSAGAALARLGRHGEAIAAYEAALRLESNEALTHRLLATSLHSSGRFDEAEARFRKALELDPLHVDAIEGLRALLAARRPAAMPSALREQWQKTIDLRPTNHAAWHGYAELCLYLGREDEYRRVRTMLLERFGNVSHPQLAERVGRACLLMPASEEELRRAAALVDLAVARRSTVPEWVHPFILFAKGLSEYRQGRWDEAVVLLEGEARHVLGPAPGLVAAMASQRMGRTEAARRTLAAAVAGYDWGPDLKGEREGWMYHVLRREAEQMILSNLPAFLGGSYRPTDNVERLALLGACQSRDLQLATAELYLEAFASDSALGEDPAAGHRYRAACAANSVGFGRGADAAGVGPEERVRWRRQSREWLRADLAWWGRRAVGATQSERAQVQERLALWRADPRLVAIWTRAEIAALPIEEQQEYAEFWVNFSAVRKSVLAAD